MLFIYIYIYIYIKCECDLIEIVFFKNLNYFYLIFLYFQMGLMY